MFIDEVKIQIKSGKGGDGIVAFRREKYIPNGGPSGGDGGKGGSIIFEANEGLSTLIDLRYMKHVNAKPGENGKIKNMHGKDAEDIIIKVPVGTICYEEDTNRVICDLTKHGERKTVAKGGRGGRGNQHFATPRDQAPKFQENGELGKTYNLRIELKLLADVGIIGFPSVGKSTLISQVTGSRPKIAPYPFTTIIPNLGVVDIEGVKSFVLADMPGLIEGASQGLGLGFQFLKHIERTKVLLHVIDMSNESGRDAYEDYLLINHELETYKYHLRERPQIVVANKMDLPESEENYKKFLERYDGEFEIYPISALTREGLKLLMLKTSELIDKTKAFQLFDDNEVLDELIVRFEDNSNLFNVEKIDDVTYNVSGEKIDFLLSRSNFMTDESVMKFLHQLRKIGVEDALRQAGAKNTDTIKVGDFEFEFVE